MPIARTLTVLLITIFGSYSLGSGITPCAAFVSADGRSFSLDKAYQASDLLVIGQVTYGVKPTLKIKNKIKGNEKSNEIELTSVHCQGTACFGGFSVAPKMDLLFFLKRQANGAYDSVAGNGNFSCPVVFEINNGAVIFGDKLVPIGSLNKYLQTKSSLVPLH